MLSWHPADFLLGQLRDDESTKKFIIATKHTFSQIHWTICHVWKLELNAFYFCLKGIKCEKDVAQAGVCCM